MKSILRYWWTHSLAYDLWVQLTPFGRWVVWLPATLLAYVYMICMIPFSVMELLCRVFIRSSWDNPGKRKVLWR